MPEYLLWVILGLASKRAWLRSSRRSIEAHFWQKLQFCLNIKPTEDSKIRALFQKAEAFSHRPLIGLTPDRPTYIACCTRRGRFIQKY
jgi:hypothetical protein